MKLLLVFLAGVLVGANVVYFLLVRPATPRVRAVAVARTAEPATSISATGTSSPAQNIRVAPSQSSTVSGNGLAPTMPTMPADVAVTLPLEAGAARPVELAIPVSGVTASQLLDTFNDARGGERRHEALDIMASRGTPVVATSDGVIEKLFDSKPGGLTIYEFDPTRTYAYYYAHLDRYAAGLTEGNEVRRGEVIGYVGSTGNASPDTPHLHFAIFVLGPGSHWWQGTAIDPYPLLGGGKTR